MLAISVLVSIACDACGSTHHDASQALCDTCRESRAHTYGVRVVPDNDDESDGDVFARIGREIAARRDFAREHDTRPFVGAPRARMARMYDAIFVSFDASRDRWLVTRVDARGIAWGADAAREYAEAVEIAAVDYGVDLAAVAFDADVTERAKMARDRAIVERHLLSVIHAFAGLVLAGIPDERGALRFAASAMRDAEAMEREWNATH